MYNKGYIIYDFVYPFLFTVPGEKLFQQRKKENDSEHSSGSGRLSHDAVPQ